MAEVIHRYVGKSGKPPPGPSKEERRQKEAKGKLDVEFVAEKTEQVRIRRMQTAMAVAKARGELVESSFVEKQPRFCSWPCGRRSRCRRPTVGVCLASVMRK
jgi:hypothetical protein